jgi:hypothetical protein
MATYQVKTNEIEKRGDGILEGKLLFKLKSKVILQQIVSYVTTCMYVNNVSQNLEFAS